MLPELRSMLKDYLDLGLAMHWLPPKSKGPRKEGWSKCPGQTSP